MTQYDSMTCPHHTVYTSTLRVQKPPPRSTATLQRPPLEVGGNQLGGLGHIAGDALPRQEPRQLGGGAFREVHLPEPVPVQTDQKAGSRITSGSICPECVAKGSR